MGLVQNGILHLRYRSDFVITKAECCKAVRYKHLHYSIVENAPRLPLTFRKVEKIIRKNIRFLLLLLLLSLFIFQYEDTTGFLLKLDSIGNISPGTILATLDITSLYTISLHLT